MKNNDDDDDEMETNLNCKYLYEERFFFFFFFLFLVFLFFSGLGEMFFSPQCLGVLPSVLTVYSVCQSRSP